MLSAAPMLRKGDSGLELRDFVVEISRLVLGPRFLHTLDYQHASGRKPICSRAGSAVHQLAVNACVGDGPYRTMWVTWLALTQLALPIKTPLGGGGISP